MHRLRTALAVSLSVLLGAGPLAADVIPASRERARTAPREALARPLAREGLTARQIARMPTEDLAYFATDAARVRIVGDIGGTPTLWYEKAGGYVLMVGLVGVITALVVNNRDT